MVDLHPLALAYLRAIRSAAWTGRLADVERSADAWNAAGHPIEADTDAPDRAGFVRVRIAVIVGVDGWASGGGDGFPAKEAAKRMLEEVPDARLTYVEAWVPRPEAPETVEGEVAGE
jgi:hypothetical protein